MTPKQLRVGAAEAREFSLMCHRAALNNEGDLRTAHAIAQMQLCDLFVGIARIMEGMADAAPSALPTPADKSTPAE